MSCLVCGKQIGIFRRLWDRKYCCDRHRKTARKLSARAVRDAQDFDELEEPWLITPGLPDERKKTPGMGVSPAAGILLLVLIIFVVLVAPPRSGTSPVPRQRNRSLSVLNQLRQILPGAPTVDFQTDFRADLSDWVGAFGEANWAREAGKIRFNSLQLWNPTMSMGNYQMVFQGQIESKAMSWAFRAKDADNYYAAKLAVPGPGGPPRAEIIRYAMVAGKKIDLVALPLPVALQADTPYKIKVRVKDNKFSTLVNGQVVDTWTDPRHSRGGVGFFSDPGERALISWVRVNNAEGLFGGLFSFSLLVGPSELYMGPSGTF
jgi:hypothetical protein